MSQKSPQSPDVTYIDEQVCNIIRSSLMLDSPEALRKKFAMCHRKLAMSDANVDLLRKLIIEELERRGSLQGE